LSRTQKLYSVLHHGTLDSLMKSLSCLTLLNALLALRAWTDTVTLCETVIVRSSVKTALTSETFQTPIIIFLVRHNRLWQRDFSAQMCEKASHQPWGRGGVCPDSGQNLAGPRLHWSARLFAFSCQQWRVDSCCIPYTNCFTSETNEPS